MANKTFKSYTVVTKTRLNVRKSASVEAEIVKVLEAGTSVKILGKTNNFGRIGKCEYVMLKFTERTDG